MMNPVCWMSYFWYGWQFQFKEFVASFWTANLDFDLGTEHSKGWESIFLKGWQQGLLMTTLVFCHVMCDQHFLRKSLTVNPFETKKLWIHVNTISLDLVFLYASEERCYWMFAMFTGLGTSLSGCRCSGARKRNPWGSNPTGQEYRPVCWRWCSGAQYRWQDGRKEFVQFSLGSAQSCIMFT